jgi:adenosylhomocysteine nucleosidase
MRIGIIGAMSEEIGPVIRQLHDPRHLIISGMTFVSGQLGNHSAVAVCSGIGKINATVCTQILVSQFAITHGVFTGVAGGIAPGFDIGDIILGEDIIQYDMDVTALGYELGFVPRLGIRSLPGDPALIKSALRIGESDPQRFGKVVRGRILTGDSFIASHERGRGLYEGLGGLCVDMEGAAVAQACYLAQIPSLVIRSLSDKADAQANLDYKACIRLAANRAADLTCAFLSTL